MSIIIKKAMRVIVPPTGCAWETREYYDPTGVNSIGWTGRTLNPWRGCRHVKGRDECDFCWSASETWGRQLNPTRKTLYGLELVRNDPDTDMGRLEPRKLFTGLLVPQTEPNWVGPLSVQERGLWFYGDCIDLFHEDILADREEVVLYWLRIMQLARWQVFQVLTKRATLMKHFMERLYVRADGWLDLVPKGQVVPWDEAGQSHRALPQHGAAFQSYRHGGRSKGRPDSLDNLRRRVWISPHPPAVRRPRHADRLGAQSPG